MSEITPESNSSGTLEVGSFIGGTYRVLGFIGQGGMGFVYKVEHMMMAKILALKVLRSEQVSEEVWKRFRIEAQAIARLDHANVVRIYDMSQTEAGLPFYTMDLLDGESLADYLDEYYRLPLRDALPIFRQVCAGLAYAHDRGIVHRDIKPGNIMLLADGRENAPSVVKIVDFGIAKLSSFDNGFGQGLTRPGEVFGSPLYMSPEQCLGQQLDHRTDMYSVGVTMFQALTGRPPLLGKTAIETTVMHQSVVPPAMSEAIVLEDDEEPIVFPAELEEIVARLLAKSPDDRYDSLADVATDLLALERGEGRIGRVSSSGVTALSAGAGMAPYAVAEAARRRASYAKTQVLTSGQSDTDSSIGGSGRKSLLLALAAVFVLIGLLTLAAATYIVIKGKAEDQRPVGRVKAATIDGLVVKTAVNELKKFDSEPDEPSNVLTAIQRKEIESYLASHRGFYSKPVQENGKTIYVFDFPNNFDLGEITYNGVPYPLPSREPAKGIKRVSVQTGMHLSCSLAVLAYPELLKFFRPNELVEVCFNDKNERSVNFFPVLQNLTSVSRLELKGTHLEPSDLTAIDKLAAVEELCLDRSNLPGSELARLKILSRLKTIGLTSVKEITPLLKKIAKDNKIVRLEADDSNLSEEDCKYIGQMPNMENLALIANPLTDAGVAHFVALKKLRVLDLKQCQDLTVKSLVSLEQMKSLEEFYGNVELIQPANEKRIKKALPKLRIFDY